MYDRRIVRGNTYALHTLPAVSTSGLYVCTTVCADKCHPLEFNDPDPMYE